MLILLTKKLRESLFDIEFYISELKYFLKKIIQGNRGPSVVIDNLIKGLDELKINFKKDPSLKNIDPNSTICVIRDAKALKSAIKIKEKGIAKEIIAGPNIAVTPKDFDHILFDENIDKIIVPSNWVKEFYEKFSHNDKNLSEKIYVWPSGINIPKENNIKKKYGIIYKKNIPEDIYKSICEYLDENKYNYKIYSYGNFNQKNFIKDLSQAKWMIYLQNIESQGLAMFEAWANDVPTLVWSNKEYKVSNVNFEFKYPISSPYLSEECGIFFTGKDDFGEIFNTFIKKQFQPKLYVENNFTNQKSAEKYLNIINEKNN